MSSDDESPSLEKDKKSCETSNLDSVTPTSSSAKQKFKFVRKKKSSKEGNISLNTLANIYELNTGLKAPISDEKRSASDDNIEVESGVEALEDINFQQAQTSGTEESDHISTTSSDFKLLHQASTDEDVLSNIIETIDNVKIDDDQVLNIQQVSGADIRRSFLSEDKNCTYLAPEGFVDVRSQHLEVSWVDMIYG